MPYKEIYTGIYKIQSGVHPDRCYIGSAVDIRKRWMRHKWELKGNRHENPRLQHHYNKYGIEDLDFSIVAICEREELRPIDGIIRPEQFFIWAYDPFFNINKIAQNGYGYKMSEETKEKLRRANIGKKASLETRLKMSASHMGRVDSEETHRKKSAAQMGNKKGLGKIPWNKGIKTGPQSAETCRKRSEKQMNPSEETLRKRRESCRRTWELKKQLKKAA